MIIRYLHNQKTYLINWPHKSFNFLKKVYSYKDPENTIKQYFLVTGEIVLQNQHREVLNCAKFK